MTYRVHHSPPGEGTELFTVDSYATVKISAEDTEGAYELFEIDAPRESAIPLHRHPWPEAYYVLYGLMTVQVDEKTYDLRPGASVTIPPSAAHTFTTLTPSVKFLALNLTDGAGRLFADLDRNAPRDKPIHEIVPVLLQIAERNGASFVAPPG
jgi:quercetin dioxygenase-like cupin family protein